MSSNYESYMRNMLGYNMISDNMHIYQGDIYEEGFNNYSNLELEKYYPEIYKMLYPMVQKKCSQNIETINETVINKMTDEIYNAMEETKWGEEIRSSVKISNDLKGTKNETRGKNHMLRDIIMILIIEELLCKNKHHHPHHHPYCPGGYRVNPYQPFAMEKANSNFPMI